MNLNWPAELGRTEADARRQNRRYETDLSQSIDDLEQELERLGVDDWRLETAMDHQSRNPNRPYANQPDPDDPGAVVRWSMDGEQFAVGCDAYSRVRDNVRTIGLYIGEKRKMEQRPVVTGESEFANARLPAADIVAEEPPHEMLSLEPDATPEEIKRAFRDLAKETHPDQGGSKEAFSRVEAAKEAMLE